MSNAFDYNGARDIADTLLAQFGQPITIRRIDNSTGGADWAPGQTTTDYATLAAIVALPRWYPPMEAGSDIIRTDKRGLIAAGPLTAAGVVVQKKDSLIAADGTVFSILDVKPVNPAGVTVMYDCWLRI